MTYQELLLDAIKYDEEKLAYSVYWLIKNGTVRGTDNAKSVNWDLVNHQEVQAMRERNELNLNPIKLFTFPLGDNKHFLVFARDEQSAKGHCLNETTRAPTKVFDITNQLDKSFWFPDKNKYQTLRELKDETLMFPATAMIFEKG
ncbi:hypothetical protein D1B33_07590 [Lysinibacillus yapensis]|uniref:Uncharacterized protein n=1 Tax=Ureibacillus yapensis TaxID=2304605 RepID=A0A396SFB7_9BACL|nr:hypothetical protein [Lysinibacillus yapensis]RHW38726.1 hypothetical protein D1B33_07590 [Lysinibacillus yapensis]